MAHIGSKLAGHVRDSIALWFDRRMQECVRCTGCESSVFPFASTCPKCGQPNPTQVSTSAVVCLVFGFVFLAVVLYVLASLF
jgi:hypothetical protein